MHDVETDLNTPRPISAGGTGANNAADAMAALGGEIANQQVTNYDTFPFKSGTFWSASGATSAPTSDVFYQGICYTIIPPGNDFFIEARSTTTSIKYLRHKLDGVWQSWVRDDQDSVDLANTKVNRSGDTMTGPLLIQDGLPELQLISTGAPFVASVSSRFGPNTRWQVLLLDGMAEGGGNTGSGFAINSYNDAGSYLDTPLSITRADGHIHTNGYVPATGSEVTNKAYVDAQIGSLNTGVNAKVAKAGDTMTGNLTLPAVISTSGFYFVDGTHSLTYNSGTNRFALSGAAGIDVGGNVVGTIMQATSNAYYFNAGSQYLAYVPGSNRFLLAGSGGLDIGGTLYTNSGIATDGGVASAGAITGNGGVVISAAAAAGNCQFMLNDETGATKGWFSWNRGPDNVGVYNSAFLGLNINPDGNIRFTGGQNGKAGTAGAYDGNAHNFYWTGTQNQMWIDATNFGNVQVACDYRVKKDVVPLASTWSVVKALKPIVYTHAAFSLPANEDAAHARGEEAAPLFTDDDEPHWGFLAHELQETLLPSAAHGYKDSPEDIQTPNVLCVVAALTRALQEAMARIEALEQRR